MRFEFSTPARIIFGRGTASELPELVAGLGERILVVTGKSPKRVSALLDAMADHHLAVDIFDVPIEPTVSMVEDALARARAFGPHVLVGIGGGSAMDTAKCVAALYLAGGEVLDFLEVVGGGQALTAMALPCIAVPTTAGTGSEVTRNAVLAVDEKHVKVSLRGPTLMPRLAIVDPELTYTLPPAETASSGMDALVQLIEPFLSIAANPMTDALCRDGIRRIARALRRAYADSADREARADMSLAAMLSGMALANAKLGAVHGFSGVIGGLVRAPHGAINARLLACVLEVNLRALRARAPGSDALSKFDELGRLVTGNPKAGAEDALTWIRQLSEDLAVLPLRSYGVAAEHLDSIIERSQISSSMKGNPIRLTHDEMLEILTASL